MQVAEKRMAEEIGLETTSAQEKPEKRPGKPPRSRLPSRLIERRGIYEAKGDGTYVHEPVLSPEASQPTPFLSLSWQHWLEVREQITKNLDHFASAAQEQRVDKVLNAGMEIQAAMSRIF